MVDALKQARQLLQPNGLVVNVHDLPVPHLIEANLEGSLYRVGWLIGKEQFKETRASLDALAQVVSDNCFELLDERDFEFRISADTIEELTQWQEEEWRSALLTDGVVAKVKKLERDRPAPVKIVLLLRARMTCLRAI